MTLNLLMNCIRSIRTSLLVKYVREKEKEGGRERSIIFIIMSYKCTFFTYSLFSLFSFSLLFFLSLVEEAQV